MSQLEDLQRFIIGLAPLALPDTTDPQIVNVANSKATVDGVECSVVGTTKRQTMATHEMVAFDPNADALWPGALVQGKSLQMGVLAPIGLPRAPGTVTLTTPLNVPQMSRAVERPSLPSVQEALREILAPVTAATPAKLAYTAITSESWQQGLLAAGVDAKWLSGSAQVELSAQRTTARSLVAARLTQAYYTVAFNPPARPAAVFDETVSLDDATLYLGEGNPPVYLSSVTYGRLLVLIFQSSASASELEAAVNAAMHSGRGEGAVKIQGKYADTLRSSQVHVLALGGSGQSAVKLIAGDPIQGLQAYMQEGATFSKDSPGLPISFQARYLRDNATAGMALTTSWIEKTLTGIEASGDWKVGPRSGLVDTGIRVRPGDTIHARSSGQIWSGVVATGWVDANGWATWDKPGEAGFPMMKTHPFALVGRVDGNWFYLGVGADFTYGGASDTLKLSVNTNNHGVGDGQWTVSVRVERRKET
jgi:hypothetical protein